MTINRRDYRAWPAATSDAFGVISGLSMPISVCQFCSGTRQTAQRYGLGQTYELLSPLVLATLCVALHLVQERRVTEAFTSTLFSTTAACAVMLDFWRGGCVAWNE